MSKRIVLVPLFLCLLTACRQDQLSLPVAHADEAVSVAAPKSVAAPSFKTDSAETPHRHSHRKGPHAKDLLFSGRPGDSCYALMARRPKGQREVAVQARLAKFDHIVEALESPNFTVELEGDHANTLSLEFPIAWPALQAYSDKVSAVVDEYFAVPAVRDYLCGSGFYEVKLTARGTNDGLVHPIWTAKVTSEGLTKVSVNGRRVLVEDPFDSLKASLTPQDQ